ncbi:MAG: GntR family transcriptional regulator [Gammaproteobacteria bacterium]|nr:GntR family transcriptional regulator [Gammaproteobacteria bacterium]
MATLPLYYRTYLALRDRIVNGDYDPQQPLPGEQQFAVELKVSRATLRRAFELLAEEGLIERRQGKRTYPRLLGYESKQQRRNLELGSSVTGYRGLFPGTVDMDVQQVKADAELRAQFGRRRLGRVMRVRTSKGAPYCFVVTFLPLSIADKIDWPALDRTPVISAVEAAGYAFVKVEQVITATVADEESAAAINVPLGSPLLRVSGLFIDKQGDAMMRKDGYFLPDSFEYRTTVYNKA